MREGDIEALRNRMKDEGRPIKSNTVINRDGSKIHYKVRENKVEIVGKDD